jgi:hypothetical protein
MNKTEQLLKMLEHPERYTELQWQDILADEECRELYEAMRLSADAFQMEDAKAKISAGLKDEEWQKFSMTYDADSDGRTVRRHYSLSKIAALFVGVLMLSGIAYAAYRMAHHAGDDSQKPVQELPMANSPQQVLIEEPADSVKQAPIVFENAELQTMLNEMATYYNYKVTFRSEAAKHIRLYFTWDKASKIEDVVATFNKFERIHVSIENQTLVVESNEATR